MLTVIGDLVEDIVVSTRGTARRGTDNPAIVCRRRGGSAANVAAAAAELTPTRFIGRVGDDDTGRRLIADLSATGVDVRAQCDGRTGTVIVVVDSTDGERTMFPDRAAAARLGPVDPTWLAGTSILHVPAYGLVAEPAATSILAAIGHARRTGAAISIDVSAVTLVESFGSQRFLDLLVTIEPTLVFANADEASACDLGSLATRGTTVVVKDGPRPARVTTADETFEVDAVLIDQVLDTTGAGDAFAAGFLSTWMSDQDPVIACRAAHHRAATVLRAPG